VNYSSLGLSYQWLIHIDLHATVNYTLALVPLHQLFPASCWGNLLKLHRYILLLASGLWHWESHRKISSVCVFENNSLIGGWLKDGEYWWMGVLTKTESWMTWLLPSLWTVTGAVVQWLLSTDKWLLTDSTSGQDQPHMIGTCRPQHTKLTLNLTYFCNQFLLN